MNDSGWEHACGRKNEVKWGSIRQLNKNHDQPRPAIWIICMGLWIV